MATENDNAIVMANESDANDTVNADDLAGVVDDVDEDFSLLSPTSSEGDDDAADITNSVATLGNVSGDFTLFPHLPIELRLAVWKLAMKEPRLVHLHARGCGVRKGHKRRGCPKGFGLRLWIHGAWYEQVPSFFFVNYECRMVALQIYTIRFSVVQEFRPGLLTPVVQRATNIIMSPDDILTSWHTNDMLRAMPSRFVIEFGPQASLVRNIMVNPWRLTYDVTTLEVVSRLVSKLGNKDVLEKVYLLPYRGLGALKFRGSVQIPMDVTTLASLFLRINFRGLEARHCLQEMEADNRPEWLYADAE